MASIYDPIPNSPFYYPSTQSLSTPQGYVIAGSGVSVDQFGVLNVASALGGTVTTILTGVGLSGGPISVSGTIDLVPATNISLGGVKVGANLIIASDGTLSALPPGTGTITGVVAGSGLTGGGSSGVVTLSLAAASTTSFGGVSVNPSGGIDITSGAISLAQSTASQLGGVRLATAAEVIAGIDVSKVITPSTLAAKTATTLRPGVVQLSDNASLTNSTLAATPTAVKTAFDAATAAQATASAALPKSGGAMTGIITFAPGQTFPGVALPKATTNSLGVISVGPGLSVNSSGVLSTANNGTVTAITAGPGLGAPASGNVISTFGTLRLLPPTTDGTTLGGVKAGANIDIAFDGTISVPGTNFLATNNQYAFNGYQWPIPKTAPALPCPGVNGQVLTIANNVTGELAWTSTGTLTSVVAGAGLSVTSTPTAATVSLATVPSVTAGSYGGTALIPVFQVNAYGQLISAGETNPFTPFQTVTVASPYNLVLDFITNSTNWQWTLQGNTTIQNPLNAVPGQTGALVITQDPGTSYSLAWGSSWKFANGAQYSGNLTPGTVDMIEFRVVAANYIVVTNVISNIS